MRRLVVDGMLNGTGIRDLVAGGYILPEELNLDASLINKINDWLAEYALEHYRNYSNEENVNLLDDKGMIIASLIQKSCPDDEIGYYSDAKLTKLPVKVKNDCSAEE